MCHLLLVIHCCRFLLDIKPSCCLFFNYLLSAIGHHVFIDARNCPFYHIPTVYIVYIHRYNRFLRLSNVSSITNHQSMIGPITHLRHSVFHGNSFRHVIPAPSFLFFFSLFLLLSPSFSPAIPL